MGYELHITRRAAWHDTSGPAISESEWQQAISSNADADAYYWFDGNVSAKNPGPSVIGEMVRLAEGLGATVQGDDGEFYREDGTSYTTADVARPPRNGVLARLLAAFRPRFRAPSTNFRAGQRVKDVWGGYGTVTFVDPRANGQLGSVRVKMDDGREQNQACIASGFEIIS